VVVSSVDSNGEAAVRTQLLDVDASGGTDEACAQAMRASMNKLKAEDDAHTHLLCGQCTDSGGGGTLESFRDAMNALHLCNPFYLIANCCIHALQLQLGNAIKATFGEGGLDKVNVMQMLHSVYRLQEALELDEWRHMLFKACDFVRSFDVNNVPDFVDGEPARQRNKTEFLQSFAKVCRFHSKFRKPVAVDFTTLSKFKQTTFGKMVAPVLTRWWTVGSGASYMFDCFLHVYYACQVVINTHRSESTPYKIASDLFSFMTVQENFVDLCLMRSFHKGHINHHFDWLQDCDDLTGGEKGFQSHNMAIRCFLMQEDLRKMLTRRSMPDYFEAINGIDDDGAFFKKLTVFVGAASESLHKHCIRWLQPSLLPAALMSEAPMARAIAAAITDTPRPDLQECCNHLTGFCNYNSTAHGRVIELHRFDKFIRERLLVVATEFGAGCCQESIAASQLMLQDGVDFRLKTYGPTTAHAAARWFMHSSCLALACQTQFVESGVKDASHVASTDRSEAHRSWLAIIRSVSPLTVKGIDKANMNKIKALTDSAFERVEPHEEWKDTQEDGSHDKRFNALMTKLSNEGHFQVERKEAKKTNIDDNGDVFKRQNVAQQPKPQQLQPAITGLLPHSKLVKKRNLDDLKTELLFRDVPEDVIPKSITDRKDTLRLHESWRLMHEDNVDEDAATDQADTHFRNLSTAPFKLNDD